MASIKISRCLLIEYYTVLKVVVCIINSIILLHNGRAGVHIKKFVPTYVCSVLQNSSIVLVAVELCLSELVGGQDSFDNRMV